jgi:hypothetical protein
MKKTFNRLYKVLAALLTMSALAVGQQAWASSFTVEFSNGQFIISRSSYSTEETIMYRTVSLSAIAGVHFTEVSGTYTFPKNSTQPLRVSVNEMSPSTVNGAFLYHHNSTYRSYLFEVVDLSGYLLASTQRNIPYDNYKIMTNTAFAKQSLTVVSGETDQIT